MGEVVYVQPKQRTLNYRRHELTIKFIPEKKQWMWEFSYNIERTLHGFAESFTEAEKDAKKWIDQIEQREH